MSYTTTFMNMSGLKWQQNGSGHGSPPTQQHSWIWVDWNDRKMVLDRSHFQRLPKRHPFLPFKTCKMTLTCFSLFVIAVNAFLVVWSSLDKEWIVFWDDVYLSFFSSSWDLHFISRQEILWACFIRIFFNSSNSSQISSKFFSCSKERTFQKGKPEAFDIIYFL